MFKSALQSRVKTIFGLDKATFDLPGESREQEAVFIAVEECRAKVTDARATARVTGKIHVFAQADKLPFGYFAKCIAAAPPELTKDLFFFEFEENKGTYMNIAERSLSFIFLFDSQYDPDIGTLNQINLEISET